MLICLWFLRLDLESQSSVATWQAESKAFGDVVDVCECDSLRNSISEVNDGLLLRNQECEL